jgi:hypothetical protein
LFVGKLADLLAEDMEHAEQRLLLTQCDTERGAKSADLNQSTPMPVVRLRCRVMCQVRNFDYIFALHDPLVRGAGLRQEGPALAYPVGKARAAMGRCRMEALAVIGPQIAVGRAAQARRLFQHRREHRRRIAARGIDDLQDFGNRGLLLQGLTRFGQKPRVLHRNDRLGGEILQQRDLLVGKRPDLASAGGDIAKQDGVFAQRYDQNAAQSGVVAGAGNQAVGPRPRQVIRNVNKALAIEQLLRRTTRRCPKRLAI